MDEGVGKTKPKRVVVVRGTIKNINYPEGERETCALWCEGDIPVGEKGTICPAYLTTLKLPSRTDKGFGIHPHMQQIVWDNPRFSPKPDNDHFFGFTGLGSELEYVEDE